MTNFSDVKLTRLASAAGCAAKLGPGDLSQLLFPLGQLFAPAQYPDLLVGLGDPDDAAVMRLNATQALIMTTDFFPPVVDDPYWYGAIAAANALSDIYAMGGDALLALNLVAFPTDQDPAILTEILRGGAEKVQESGGVLVGGHTIMDEEPKYGLAVAGLIHPENIIPKGGAVAGDALILTKPLGTGIITTALKREAAEAHFVQAAMQSMAMLNRRASEIIRGYRVHGMSDITGYSLLGHSHEMARLSGQDLHLNFDRLHWLPGAEQYAQAGIFPGGTGRNRSYYRQFVDWPAADDPLRSGMLYDPQTSGGLLAAVDGDDAEALLVELQAQGVNARLVGDVRPGSGRVVVHSSS